MELAAGLDLCRAGRWPEAVEALRPPAETGAPWAVSDYAVALHQAGRTDEAVKIMERLSDPAALPAAVRLNRLYLTQAHALWSAFDPAWKHEDLDGLADPGPAPKVSVIVRTYRRPDLLAEALASLAAQTFTDFETIVVNDGGDPASEQVVAAAGLIRARYVMLPHGGRVRALNAGLAMARGEFVTGLDDDDAAYPHHLAALAGYLDAPGAAPVVYGDYRLVTPAGRKDVTAGPYERGVLFRTNPCTILLMARRSCYEAVGRFIPELELAEDWEMWLRLAERFDFHHLAEVTAEVRERPGDANLTARRLREKYYWDNLVLYLHRGLFILSAPQRPELARGYARALALLDELLSAHPEAERLLSLRGLWDMRKPYAWFADQGRWFEQLGESELARKCYRIALALSPGELKLWVKLFQFAFGS